MNILRILCEADDTEDLWAQQPDLGLILYSLMVARKWSQKG